MAVNKRDGSSVFRLAFKVRRVMDSEVDADNAAVAFASCSDCRTVAASIQVVLAMSDVETLTTDNVSIALNYQCSACETLASAYQFVFGNGQPVRFTAEGNRRLADVRRRLQALRQRDDLTLQQLADEIDVLAGEVAKVVDEELVPTGRAGAPGAQNAPSTTTTTEGSTTSSEPTSTTTTSPDSTTTTAKTTPTTTEGSSSPTTATSD